jgi:hypothetical protein
MKKYLFKFIFVMTLISGLFVFILIKPNQVFANGNVSIIWGVPEGQPLFNFPDVKPCDVMSRTVKAKNSSGVTRRLTVKATSKMKSDAIFPKGLSIKISGNGNNLYGGNSGQKSISDLITDSNKPAGIFLLNLPPKSDKQVVFEVAFPCAAGNSFQGKSFKFDLTFGIDDVLIPDCKPEPPVCGFLRRQHNRTCDYLYKHFCGRFDDRNDSDSCVHRRDNR